MANSNMVYAHGHRQKKVSSTNRYASRTNIIKWIRIIYFVQSDSNNNSYKLQHVKWIYLRSKYLLFQTFIISMSYLRRFLILSLTQSVDTVEHIANRQNPKQTLQMRRTMACAFSLHVVGHLFSHVMHQKKKKKKKKMCTIRGCNCLKLVVAALLKRAKFNVTE